MNYTYNLITEINEGIYQNVFTDEEIDKLVKHKVKGRNVPNELLQTDKWQKLRWSGVAA